GSMAGRRYLACSRSRPKRQRPVRPDVVAAVAVRIPLEVVLMLGLGLPERPRRRHLGHDLPRPQAGSVDVGDRLLGDPALLLIEVEDSRAIARPRVVALPVERRRVVDPKEELEQTPVGGQLGIEDDLDRLGMRAVVAVGRVWNLAACVPHPRREHARLLSEEILHPPETPSGKYRLVDRSTYVCHGPPPVSEIAIWNLATATESAG